MKKIEAKVMADSICNGHRITTMLCTFPRFILSEVNTHRMFSRNSTSSRAIPFEKMVKMVEEDPFIPIAWQMDHKGMQGDAYFSGTCRDTFGHLDRAFAGYEEYREKQATEQLKEEWLEARDVAVQQAKDLNYLGLTKQLCNRLLEPFMWHTCLITATEWENFFKLRCPQYTFHHNYDGIQTKACSRSWKDVNYYYDDTRDWTLIQRLNVNESQAEIHMQALAEAMWDAMNESNPKELEPGEWHIPFGNFIHIPEFLAFVCDQHNKEEVFSFSKETVETQIEISTARCARLSYNTFDGEIDYNKDIELHDKLLGNGHLSPFEHCAKAMTQKEYDSFIKGELLIEDQGEGVKYISDSLNNHGWCNNFRGWMQYRYLIEKGVK